MMAIKVYMFYYHFKRWIPRWIQIIGRRYLARANLFFQRRHWPIDRIAARKPKDFVGWPENKGFALVLRHDVESGAGLQHCVKIMEMERVFGLRSAFFLVPKEYSVEVSLRRVISDSGCEVGVHGLRHDGKLYVSRKAFQAQAAEINVYLREWNAVGFASPSTHRRFEWLQELNILYDTSSFDTDPFEPQPDGVQTIFPMLIRSRTGTKSFIELPYTLPQDFTLFVILQQTSIKTWQKKLDWVAAKGGMVLFNTHPDYMSFPGEKNRKYTYPCDFYEQLLAYVEKNHHGAYWAALPREVAGFWCTLSGNRPV
jgi:hypothetical protein